MMTRNSSPPQPRNRVRITQRGEHARTGNDEELIADRVPERIVDVLEVVQIDEEHRETLARTARAADLERDAVERHHAVGQPGEDVEVGLPMQLRLLFLDRFDHRVERTRQQTDLVGGTDLDGRVLAAAEFLRCRDQTLNRI